MSTLSLPSLTLSGAAISLPVAKDVPAVLEEYLAGQLTEGTRRIYQKDLLAFFGGQTPSKEQLLRVSPADLNNWRNAAWDQGAGLAASTINRKLTAIKTFYDYLIGMGIAQVNPANSKVVKRIKVRGWQPQLGLVVEELQALQKVCMVGQNKSQGIRDYALISMAYSGLLRRGELAQAKWGDLAKDSGRTILRLPLTKGGANDFIPIEQESLQVLDRYFLTVRQRVWQEGWEKRNPGGIWSPEKVMECPVFISLSNNSYGMGLSETSVNDAVKRRAKEAGLQGVHAHTLRHTGITHLLENGAPLHKVQELARHSDPKITMRYFSLLGRMKDSPTDVLAGNLVDLHHWD